MNHAVPITTAVAQAEQLARVRWRGHHGRDRDRFTSAAANTASPTRRVAERLRPLQMLGDGHTLVLALALFREAIDVAKAPSEKEHPKR